MEALGSIPDGPTSSLGISRSRAPVQASDIQPNPTAVGMQASPSRTQDTRAALTDRSSHPAATACLNTAASDVAKTPASHAAAGRSQRGVSQGEGLPGAAGSQQRPAETAADGINSLYYNLGAADRPLSSFAQRGGSTSAARPAGAISRAASDLGGTCHTQQDVEAEAGASKALDTAPAAGKQMGNAILASAAALAGTEMLLGQHQESYSADPLLTAGQHEQGYSAAAPNTTGHVEQHQEIFSAEPPHEAPPLQSPGHQPDQAGLSPQESVLWFKGRDSTQQQSVSDTGLSTHPAQWHTDNGPESIRHQAAAPAGDAGHAVTANRRQQPTLGHDVGHVAAGPGADMVNLLPAPTGPPTLGHDAAAGSQSGASAAAARRPNVRIAGEDVGAASPSGFSSSFLGQSLDLSKVSLLI